MPLPHYIIITIETILVVLIIGLRIYPGILKKRIDEGPERSRKKNYQTYIRSKQWEDLRRSALERANYKCEFCTMPYSAVHHVRYPKRYKDDHVDNLLVVCDKCHAMLHGIRDQNILKPKDIKHSEEVRGGSHSYFFDVRTFGNGTCCLDITEVGKRGRRTIRVFEAYLSAFNAALVNGLALVNGQNNNDKLLSDKIMTDSGTLFFDVQFAVNGRKYLKITESREVNNGFERIDVIVFEDGTALFGQGYKNVLGYFTPTR